jgi:type IV secretory pathway VirB10-like protein
MKMKTVLSLCISSFFLLTACQDKEAASTETPINVTETETAVAPAPTEITTTPAPAAAAAAPQGEAPKLNPAHGQPFHRCEIAVGAPLDGSAQTAPPAPQADASKSFFKTVQSEQKSTPAPTMTTTPAPKSVSAPVQKTQTTTAQTATAEANTPRPKNNPAHGQPHHRCEIKVGDPLPEI